MDYSTPLLSRARYLLGHKIGLLKPIVRFVGRIRPSNYEEHFDAALMKSIAPGDTVWDVGANQGYYTRKFLDKVKTGTVVAFEPSPKSFEYLMSIFGQTPNVRLENVALAEHEGEAPFFISDSSPEDSLFNRNDDFLEKVLVRTAKAD